MKTYWDHTEAERAQMTEEQVRAFEAYELMDAGIVKATKPEPITEIKPKVQTHTVFTVKLRSGYHTLGVAFASPDQARNFIESGVLALYSDWDGKESVNTIRHLDGAKIEIQEAVSGESLDAVRAEWDRYKAAQRAYDAAEEAYEKCRDGEAQAVHAMWEDWHKQREWHGSLARVISTFREYTATAGDATVAAKFLRKAFPESTITEASEVFGVEIPSCAA